MGRLPCRRTAAAREVARRTRTRMGRLGGAQRASAGPPRRFANGVAACQGGLLSATGAGTASLAPAVRRTDGSESRGSACTPGAGSVGILVLTVAAAPPPGRAAVAAPTCPRRGSALTLGTPAGTLKAPFAPCRTACVASLARTPPRTLVAPGTPVAPSALRSIAAASGMGTTTAIAAG